MNSNECKETCQNWGEWPPHDYMLIRLGQLGVVEGGRELKVYSRAACKRLFALIVNDVMLACSAHGLGDVTG